MQGHANVHVHINATVTATPINRFQHYADFSQRCVVVYSTTAATAANAPAAPMPIAGPICIAAPLACVEGPVVLPVSVCVPPIAFAEPVELVEPPFAAPVVDAGVDVVWLTEPAVITTGRN